MPCSWIPHGHSWETTSRAGCGPQCDFRVALDLDPSLYIPGSRKLGTPPCQGCHLTNPLLFLTVTSREFRFVNIVIILWYFASFQSTSLFLVSFDHHNSGDLPEFRDSVTMFHSSRRCHSHILIHVEDVLGVVQ